MSKILVLGAGELGTAILTQLVKLSPSNSPKITVLLRPSTYANPPPALRSLPISLLPGDISISTPSELAPIFAPFDTIISCLGFASGPGSQLKIARAVLEAGVKRYMPWQFGVDYEVVGRGSGQDLWDEQLDVRELLRAQNGTKWLIVSTGLFTSFLFEEYFGIVRFGEKEVLVRALGSWDNRVTVTGPRDIGRLTAMLALEDWTEQIVHTAGETISYARLAEVVGELTGKEVKKEVWTVERLGSELKESPDDTVKKYRVAFAKGRGVSWDLEKTVNWKRGIEIQDVRGWAIGNLKDVVLK